MNFRRNIALVFLLLGQQAFADSSRAVLVVGDSLSAAFGIAAEDGWVHLLRRRLEDEGYACHVVNASITGDTTRGGLARLPALLEREPRIFDRLLALHSASGERCRRRSDVVGAARPSPAALRRWAE